MTVLPFILGKKYGEIKDKKEKQKFLVYIVIFFLIPLPLALLFLGDWFLLVISVIPIIFLYLKFIK